VDDVDYSQWPEPDLDAILACPDFGWLEAYVGLPYEDMAALVGLVVMAKVLGVPSSSDAT
jgi:hypothetical protein